MLANLPLLNVNINTDFSIPDEQACLNLWDQYEMLPHIRKHCAQVANLAVALAQRAVDMGKPDVRALSLAAGLLHDLAKSYTVQYGGSHTQIGASWVLNNTANPLIAQAVLHHVWWPWDFNFTDITHPSFYVLYADKRVMHDTVVSLEERQEDLLMRYGHSEASRQSIFTGMEHGRELEQTLNIYLEIELEKCTLIGRRLVK